MGEAEERCGVVSLSSWLLRVEGGETKVA